MGVAGRVRLYDGHALAATDQRVDATSAFNLQNAGARFDVQPNE